MNIFYLHQNPEVAAKAMCNKHIVKMILESAQMLSTAHQILDGESDEYYKAAYVNHPSSVWVRQSSRHYQWLYEHFVYLNMEYSNRYNRTHMTYRKLNEKLSELPANISDNGFVEPPCAMPDIYKCDTAIMSYRQYYYAEKLFTPNDEKRFREVIRANERY